MAKMTIEMMRQLYILARFSIQFKSEISIYLPIGMGMTRMGDSNGHVIDFTDNNCISITMLTGGPAAGQTRQTQISVGLACMAQPYGTLHTSNMATSHVQHFTSDLPLGISH